MNRVNNFVNWHSWELVPYLSTKLSSGFHLCMFSTIFDMKTLFPQPFGPDTINGWAVLSLIYLKYKEIRRRLNSYTSTKCQNTISHFLRWKQTKELKQLHKKFSMHAQSRKNCGKNKQKSLTEEAKLYLLDQVNCVEIFVM